MINLFGLDGWRWLNEPPQWTHDDHTLTVTAAPNTDFWRLTHYGYIRDTGHLLARPFPGDFRMVATLNADYRAQYDQAGLMVRIDDRNWIKAGTELDGQQLLSVVVTRDMSDWSVIPLTGSGTITLELERTGDTLTVRYGHSGEPDTLLRLAYLPPETEALAGPMCAAPTGSGFSAHFTDLRLEPR
jgi:uncharacterized protein